MNGEDPLTTSLDIQVKEDAIVEYKVLSRAIFWPGDIITKDKLAGVDVYESGKRELNETEEFEFVEEGYMFTYEDIPGGGDNYTKTFTYIHNNEIGYIDVPVRRVPHNVVKDMEEKATFTGDKLLDAGVNEEQKDYENINIDGLICNIENGYIEEVNGENCLSFGNGEGRIYNTVPTDFPIRDVSLLVALGSRNDVKIWVSEDATNYREISINLGQFNLIYRYFMIEFEGESTKEGMIKSISIKGYIDNLDNVVNFIMIDDTEGQCVNKLDNALFLLNSMDTSDIDEFLNSDNYCVSNARERLFAWARNQGKDIQLENEQLVVISTSSRAVHFSYNNQNNYTLIIVIALSTLTTLSFVVLLMIKKRN